MKQVLILVAFLFVGGIAFSQTNEENNKEITSLKASLKKTSDKETIKTLGNELKIREALAQGYKNNNQALISRKKDELKSILDGGDKGTQKSGDYNSSRSYNKSVKKTK